MPQTEPVLYIKTFTLPTWVLMQVNCTEVNCCHSASVDVHKLRTLQNTVEEEAARVFSSSGICIFYVSLCCCVFFSRFHQTHSSTAACV